MGLFGSRKNKEKTLEELAQGFNIIILSDPGEKYFEVIGTYEQKIIIGSGYTLEEAREHLLINAKDWGAHHLVNPGQPREKQAPLNSKKTIYTFYSRAYK